MMNACGLNHFKNIRLFDTFCNNDINFVEKAKLMSLIRPKKLLTNFTYVQILYTYVFYTLQQQQDQNLKNFYSGVQNVALEKYHLTSLFETKLKQPVIQHQNLMMSRPDEESLEFIVGHFLWYSWVALHY